MELLPNDMLGKMGKFLEDYIKAYADPIRIAGKQLADFRAAIEGITKPLVDFAKKARFAADKEELNRVLEPHGWFVPPLLSQDQVADLQRIAVVDKDADAAIVKLIKYSDDGLDSRIVDVACAHKAFKKRRVLIDEALEAHIKGRYALSIPVFLAQAEGAYLQTLEEHGISRDMLFRKSNWDPNDVEALIEELPVSEIVMVSTLRGFSTAMYTQFAARVYSSQDLKSLKNQYSKGFLSRHAVFHGWDESYNTKENSIKALFLLDSIRGIIEILSAYISSTSA